MNDPGWFQRHAALSLERLMPRLRAEFANIPQTSAEWQSWEARLGREWPRLFELLARLYGTHYDFFYHLEQLLLAIGRSWLARSDSLKQLDRERETEPLWFQSQKMLGYVLYVDLWSGTLRALHEQIAYLKELGVTYLHLMPLFTSPEGNSDGGYAVSSYRHVNPALGSMDDLTTLAGALREEGISLVVDFVFNHTSNEHEWARRARAGDPVYEDFYFLFPDRTMPDTYDQTLRDIFPEVRRGSFTWYDDISKWVWTTFNSFQWDLNYSNPALFRAMAEEMLYLANAGVEILRLDAVAFIWKRLGTNSENQPEAHLIIQAFNAIARLAAPSLLFKSEAIVHPDDVMKYIHPDECQLSYNPLLMALLWEALATRETKLLERSMRHRFRLPPGTAWINYLRSHDDIGWTFDDGDAAAVGINAFDHRHFLNVYYTGRFSGTFARGVAFQENAITGDARLAGTLASLAGLEQALQDGDEQGVAMAVQRILMLHSIILSIGGIPLIYAGDEIGSLNDYAYSLDPSKADDSRWVHRPFTQWERVARRREAGTVEARLFSGLARLIQLRKKQAAFWDGEMDVIDSGNPHLFGFIRHHGGQRLLVVANFSEHSQTMDANRFRIYGMGYHFVDLVSDRTCSAQQPLPLEPYQFVWLAAASD